MGLSTLRSVGYRGLATCVPTTVVANTDVPPHMVPERERLVRNIGIHQRRICKRWQCFSDLALVAAEKLLGELGWDRDSVDALIVVTQSPDYLIPATAIILQDRLKLGHATIAYDVNLGCSGYPFALHMVGSMISAGAIKRAIILVGDKCATEFDPIFSDAATATALEHDPGAAPIHFDLNSDGSGYRAIILPVGGHREPTEIQHLIPVKDADGVWRRAYDLQLDGTAVLSFSTQRVPPAVERLLGYAEVGIDTIDHFLFHQANRMINETIRKKLRLPVEKVPSTLHDFGNTSGASIPLTMTARIAPALREGGKRLLLAGFGIGLSWGECVIDINNAVFPDLIEA